MNAYLISITQARCTFEGKSNLTRILFKNDAIYYVVSVSSFYVFNSRRLSFYWLLSLIELIYHLANKILLNVWYTRFSEKGGNSLLNVTYLKTGRFLLIFFQSQWVLLLYLAERVLNESFKVPSLRTRTCLYKGVRNVSFSENFTYVLNVWSLNILFFIVISNSEIGSSLWFFYSISI